MNRSDGSTALVPPLAVTVTSTVPVAWAGEVTVTRVPAALTPVTAAAAVPNATAVVPWRSVPAILTVAPPEPGPVDGVTPVTTGASVVTVQVKVVEPDWRGMALSVAVKVTG